MRSVFFPYPLLVQCTCEMIQIVSQATFKGSHGFEPLATMGGDFSRFPGALDILRFSFGGGKTPVLGL